MALFLFYLYIQVKYNCCRLYFCDDSGNKSKTSIHIVVETSAVGELVAPEETETVASNDKANKPKKNTGNDSKNTTTNGNKPAKGNTSTPAPEPTPVPAPAPEPTPAPEPAKNLCPYTLYQVMDLGNGTMGYYAPRYAEYQDVSADFACYDQLCALGYTDNYNNVEVGAYDDTYYLHVLVV